MSTIARRKHVQKPVDKTTALELLVSALTYLQTAGLEVRASNISSGLAIVIGQTKIDPDSGRIVPITDAPPVEELNQSA